MKDSIDLAWLVWAAKMLPEQLKMAMYAMVMEELLMAAATLDPGKPKNFAKVLKSP